MKYCFLDKKAGIAYDINGCKLCKFTETEGKNLSEVFR